MIRFVIAFLTAVLIAVPAQSQSLCGNRTEILDKLSGQYSETTSAMGLASNGGVVEVLTSEKNGTWTIIITSPNGTSCLIAAGESWENLPVSLKTAGKGT